MSRAVSEYCKQCLKYDKCDNSNCCDKAYQQGRADAIDEFARAYEKAEVYGCIDCKHLEDDVHCWECIAEQLKEQKE